MPILPALWKLEESGITSLTLVWTKSETLSEEEYREEERNDRQAR